MLIAYLRDSDEEVIGYTVNEAYRTTDRHNDLPVFTFENLNTEIKQPFSVLVALGYTRMNGLRAQIISDCVARGYTLASYIHPTANLSGCTPGEGCIVLENVFLGPGSSVGKGNIFWNGCNMSHDFVCGDYNYFAPGVVTAGRVTVGERCFLGTGCVITSRATLGDCTLVGAAAFVAGDTEAEQAILPPRSFVHPTKKSLDFSI